MAINFPSTAGQATDGSYTYTVAGITYSWDGSSWRAAGAGASATDKTLFSVTNAAAGSSSLAYNSNTGVFTYTPPSFSGYLNSSSSINDLGDVFLSSTSDNQLLKYNAINTRWENWTPNYLTSETDPVFAASEAASITSTDTTNWDTAYGWGDHAQAGYLTGSGLQSRTTAQLTQFISSGASANVTFTTPKAYALMSIQTSVAAWVTLYSDTASRTNDASRSETTDPTPGSGVLAEVITTGSATQLITPGTICFNSSPTNATYAKIVNKSGATTNVTVTLTFVQIEA